MILLPACIIYNRWRTARSPCWCVLGKGHVQGRLFSIHALNSTIYFKSYATAFESTSPVFSATDRRAQQQHEVWLKDIRVWDRIKLDDPLYWSLTFTLEDILLGDALHRQTRITWFFDPSLIMDGHWQMAANLQLSGTAQTMFKQSQQGHWNHDGWYSHGHHFFVQKQL